MSDKFIIACVLLFGISLIIEAGMLMYKNRQMRKPIIQTHKPGPTRYKGYKKCSCSFF